MLIVLFIIVLLILVLGIALIKIAEKNYGKDWEETMCFTGVIAAVLGILGETAIVIAIMVNCYNISKLKILDKKIAMYEEENNNIQNQISEIVENYKQYEQNTYVESLRNIDTNNTDIIVLAQLYPDLKSDEMVNTQIEIYQENNNKIKQLKEEKINYQLARWWLYFGKID